MSNIFEALEQAEMGRSVDEVVGMVPVTEEVQPRTVRHLCSSGDAPVQRSVGAEMVTLYRTIEMMLPNVQHATVQFIGSHQGEGVSTIVMDVAKAAAMVFNRRVLIVDTAYHNPAHHRIFTLNELPKFRETAINCEFSGKGFYPSEHANIFIAPLANTPNGNARIPDLSSTISLLDQWKTGFDLVLVDSSPVEAMPDGIPLSRHVDGVILVIEAERTQWRSAELLKDRIQEIGGNILGIAFNKYRSHLPGFMSRLIL